jgi:geranylgeranyl pyrophosphate synthase
LETYLQACRARVEQTLDRWLPSDSVQPERLHAAMRYAAMGGGKRVRPILAYAAGAALGVPPERLDGPACALELIHAYSLVHDDLPAMDDDDLRRGRPTCHKAFDEATAILAGDALQTLAFKVLCRDAGIGEDHTVRLQMIENLAYASGSRGMAGGQAIDLEAVGAELDLVQLENMHIRKTGALILASIRMGTLSRPDADPEQVRGLERYAKCIGLAFQVQDDILDVAGETAILGKTRGKDQAHAKPTYPALLGLEGAREKAQRLCTEALENLASFDHRAEPLRWLANYIVDRDR